jgi:peptidoglycan hydrolase CwlO-like protein
MSHSGKELHDRATRGATLTAAETAALEAWYAQQDAEEAVALSSPSDSDELASLRQRVGDAMAALQSATRDIERRAAENDQLRDEIATLRRRLPLTAPPA